MAVPARERGAEDLLGLLGEEEDRQPAVGHLGGHGDVLLAQGGHPDRDAGSHGVVDQLEGLAQPRPFAGRQRDLVGRALVDERRLAGPDLAADVDDLARAGEGAVVGHAVEALDHLGARGSEAEDAAPARNGIDAGGRHGDQRGCAAVDGQNGGADLDALGLGGQEAHEARRVEAVGLGHPDDIEPDLLQRNRLPGRLFEPAGVVQRHGQLHAVLPFLRCRSGPGPVSPAWRRSSRAPILSQKRVYLNLSGMAGP